MKQIKRILIIFLIVALLMPALYPFSQVRANDEEEGGLQVLTPGLTQEQQDYLAYYVRKYLQEAYTMNPLPFIYDGGNGGYEVHYHQNELSVNELRQSGTVEKTGETYSNRMRTVCSVFTAAMLHQALGVEIYSPETIPTYRGAAYSSPNGRGSHLFNKVQDNEPLQPGDIIAWSDYGHSMIYIGCDPETGNHQIAQTCGGTRIIGIDNMRGVSDAFDWKAITPAQIRIWGGASSTGSVRYGVVSRLKPELLDPNWTIPEVTKIQWPNGMVTEWEGADGMPSTQVDTNVPLFYSGLADKVGTVSIYVPSPITMFGEIVDYLSGIVTMIIRIPFVGFASVAERLVTAVVEVTSTEPMDSVLTLEKIVYNQVPLFDINIFDMEEAGGQELTSDSEAESVILLLRQNVAKWYLAFRNLVIVLLLAILIYLGIRMAITSIAEEKAQYKRMLFDWFVSFFMVLFIHYFIVIVLKINDYFVGIFEGYLQNANMGSLHEAMNGLAHSAKFTDGWYGAIMYIALVWLMIKYAWKYAKRLLSMFILIILSPIVAISYAIDKIKDNRSQSLSKWLKEIAFTVLIQSVHALIYTVFMAGIVANITANSNVLESIGTCVFLVIAVGFMDATEDIFETIFGFKSSSSLKEVMDSSFEVFAKIKIATGWAKTYFKGAWWLTKKGAKVVGKVTGVTVNAATKVNFRPISTPAKALNQSYEAIKDGYKEAMEGKPVDDTKTLTGINKAIQQERAMAKGRQQKEKANAVKQWKSSTNIIKNFGKAMPMLVENPMAFITYSIAVGVAAKQFIKMQKKNKRTIKTYKQKLTESTDAIQSTEATQTTQAIDIIHKTHETQKNQKKRVNKAAKVKKEGGISAIFTGRKEQKNREQLLFDIRSRDIALRASIDEVYGNADNIINRGYSENATPEERKSAEELQNLINFRLKEASKTVSMKDITNATNAEISAITHKGQVIQTIKDNIEDITATRTLEDITKGVVDKAAGAVKSRTFKNHFMEELQRAMVAKATGKEDGASIKFGEMIDKSGNTLEARIESIKTNPANIALSNEELDKKISDEIGNYLKDEKNQEVVLGKLTNDDISNIATRAVENGISSEADGEITMATMKNIAQRIQEEKPEVKVNKDEFNANVKEVLQEVMINRALEQVESVKIQFGVAIDPLTGQTLESKIAESKKEAYTYSSRMQLGEKETNEEITRVVKKDIEDYLQDEKNLNAIIEQLDVEDISHIMARAINKEGSIERNYSSRNGINITTEMGAELQKYDAIINQSVALREIYVENYDRLRKSTPDLVKEIREGVNKKRETSKS